jgi:hypothetical protein
MFTLGMALEGEVNKTIEWLNTWKALAVLMLMLVLLLLLWPAFLGTNVSRLLKGKK